MEYGPPPSPNRARYPFEATLDFDGLCIYVENCPGSIRRGVDGSGHPWAVTMRAAYGELADTIAVDGDALDVYVGFDPAADTVYVVHQQQPATGRFDEDKVILGVGSADEARRLYLAHYDDPRFFGGLTAWPIEKFKRYIAARRKIPQLGKVVRDLAKGDSMRLIDGFGCRVRLLVKGEQVKLFGGGEPPAKPASPAGKQQVNVHAYVRGGKIVAPHQQQHSKAAPTTKGELSEAHKRGVHDLYSKFLAPSPYSGSSERHVVAAKRSGGKLSVEYASENENKIVHVDKSGKLTYEGGGHLGAGTHKTEAFHAVRGHIAELAANQGRNSHALAADPGRDAKSALDHLSTARGMRKLALAHGHDGVGLPDEEHMVKLRGELHDKIRPGMENFYRTTEGLVDAGKLPHAERDLMARLPEAERTLGTGGRGEMERWNESFGKLRAAYKVKGYGWDTSRRQFVEDEPARPHAKGAEPIPHASGWKTYDHVMDVGGGREHHNTFFAPDDDTANITASTHAHDHGATIGTSVTTKSLKARQASAPPKGS